MIMGNWFFLVYHFMKNFRVYVKKCRNSFPFTFYKMFWYEQKGIVLQKFLIPAFSKNFAVNESGGGRDNMMLFVVCVFWKKELEEAQAGNPKNFGMWVRKLFRYYGKNMTKFFPLIFEVLESVEPLFIWHGISPYDYRSNLMKNYNFIVL